MAVWNILNLKQIRPDRFDAEYFRPDYQSNLNNLKSTGEVTSIGRLFKFNQRGTQPSYSENGKVKVLRSVNVGNLTFNETRQEYITKVFYDLTSRGHVKKDDILITSTGVGTLGRVSIWIYKESAFCDGHITILRDSETDPYLIAAYLNSKYSKMQFDQNYRGSSGQIEIYPFDISRIIVPVLLLQYGDKIGRMVRRSFELISNSESLYTQASQLLEKGLGLNEYKKNERKFNKVFLSEITQEHRIDSQCFKLELIQYEKWIEQNRKFEKLGNLLTGTIKGHQEDILETGFQPYVSIKDIDNLEIIPSGFCNSINSSAKKNDVLLAITGATIGKVGLVSRNNQLSFSGDLLNLKVDLIKISPFYLIAVLKSHIGQTQLIRWITGSTNGHLSPFDIRKILIPRLEPDLEDKISSLLKQSIDSKIESELLIRQAKTEVESLIENAAKNAS